MQIHQLIMEVSAVLTRCPPKDFGPAVESVLEIIARHYDAQRCYLFSVSADADRFSKRFEWRAPGVAPRLESFADSDKNTLAWLAARLKKTDSVYLTGASDRAPAGEAVPSHVLVQDACSILAAPIFVEQALFGFIGLDAVENNITWPEPAIRCIETLAGIISSAWELMQVRKERDLLRVAVEQSGDLIIFADSAGNIEYVNPAFERITGYAREEILGRNPRILKSGRQNLLFYREMWHTLTQGNEWHGHFVNRKKDGSLYNEEAVIAPVKDEADRIVYYVGVKRDTTQENKLERKLVQSQKMEAIGTLAGGIAHDFNNILSAILGYAELALYEIPDGNRGRDDIQEVVKAANRARDLVRQILTFSRKAEPEFQSIDITPMVKEVLKFLRASLPSTIEIRPDIHTQSAYVLCNPTQIQQVLMNLCTNAAHAMQESGGILAVSLEDFELEPEASQRHPDLRPGRYARLTVKDDGPGIDPSHLNRIFDPYFTTKEKGEGTGLGLSVVHGIAKTLKGAIEVNSRPGDGAEFHVYFPQVVETGEIRVDPPAKPPTGSERILVVDDEDTLANLGRMMLERLGYAVTVSNSSLEALENFRSQPDSFDLVISDKTMPHLTGLELAEEIKKIRPRIPVIVCTGYSSEAEVNKAGELGIAHLLIKPLTMDDLAHAVRVVLDNQKEKTHSK
jgi:PAS domain S-box-containing protein